MTRVSTSSPHTTALGSIMALSSERSRTTKRNTLRASLLRFEQLERRELLTAQLVSVVPDLIAPVAGSDYSSNPTISSDGRFVAFQSHADDLTNVADTNGTQDVFVRDLTSGITVMISRNAEGTDSGDCTSGSCAASTVSGSFDPAMSDDGRFVAFVSYATNLTAKPIESGGSPNVFLHDRDTDGNGVFDEPGGTSTRLLSVSTDGSAAGVVVGNASRPVISGNGSSVAFLSAASDVDFEDPVPLSGINAFLADASGGRTLLTVNAGGTASGSGGTVVDLSIDDSGSIVAFASTKPNLTSAATGGVDDTNGGVMDIFVRGAGGTEAVSINSTLTGTGDDASREASISGNGKHVAFFSRSTNLAVGATDSNFSEDLFVRNLETGITTLVSRNAVSGTLAAGDGPTPPSSLLDSDATAGPKLSDNGRFIVFRSSASDLLDPTGGVVDTNELSDIFRFDRDPDMDGIFDERGETRLELVTVNATGDASTSHGELPPTTAGSYAPAISASGRYVSFVSTGVDLVPGVSGTHVYVRDMLTGVTSLVSSTPDSLTAGIAGTSPGTWVSTISGDGTRAAFQSDRDAADLDPTVTDPASGSAVPFAELDVFVGVPATDLRMLRNFANGFETHVQAYNVKFDDAEPFEVGYYVSTDAIFDASDTLLATIPITAPEDLAAGATVALSNTVGIGVGELPLPGAGVADLTEDYFILVVADPTDAITEFDGEPFSEDNTSMLRGFYHVSGEAVLVHGGVQSEVYKTEVLGDSLAVSYGLPGGGARTISYVLDDVDGVRVRTHGGDDTFIGSQVGEVVFGGEGSDRLYGNEGEDELFGGPAADFLDGGPQDDVLDGGPGPDQIFGGPGNDILYDGPGDDLLDVGDGDDTVIATPGSDDIFITSSGNDTIDFSLADLPVILDLDSEAVAQNVDGSNTVTLIGEWENFVGTAFDDTVTLRPKGIPRDVKGGPSLDKLIIDALGKPVIDDGTKISFPGTGLGSITYGGFETVVILDFAPITMDDEDSGYSSTFTHIDDPLFPQGFNGDVEYSAPDDGNTATWSFDDIPSGRYLVSATWTSAPDRSSQAPFNIYDGSVSDTLLKHTTVNQEFDPNEFEEGGVEWDHLGLVTITGNQLTVELSDEHAAVGGNDDFEFVIADAIRLEPIRDTVLILDNKDSAFESDSQLQEGVGAFGSVHSNPNPSPVSTDVGTWNFSGLASGAYQVSATWPGTIAAASPDAEFRLVSGDESGSRIVNQSAPPNDFSEDGIPWEHLGSIQVGPSGELSVNLTVNGGIGLADAIRIAPAPTIQLFDDHNNPIGDESTVNLGRVGLDPISGLATDTYTFTLQNTGLEAVELSPPMASDPFSIPDPIFGFGTLLPPGATVRIPVDLTADEVGEASGQLNISAQGIDLFQLDPLFNLQTQIIADDTPPTVMIQTPNDQATVIEGTRIDVRVDADDDISFRQVELLAGDQVVGFLDQFPFDFEFDLPTIAENGGNEVVFKARAEDTSGNMTHSDSIRVRLLNDAPPKVDIVSPSPGSQFVEGSQFPILLDVEDDVAVVRVDFRINGEIIDSVFESPYLSQITVPSLRDPFEVEAVAQDTFGHQVTRTFEFGAITNTDQIVADDSIVVGTSQGRPPVVRVVDPDGETRMQFFAYEPNFLGGVRVATGDVTGDGVPDIITGAGPGGGPHVKIFDGNNGSLLSSFFANNANFAGGVFVASGDVTGDGFADVITSAGPHVRVFSGVGGTTAPVFDFQPFGSFSGGVFVAAGDVTGDGQADIITGAGAGAGPHVKVFDGHTGSELSSFFAYDAGFTGGVRVGVGDVNRDGFDDIITGAGPGGGPHVKVFDGNSKAELENFFAYDPGYTGGVFVSAGDVNGDGLTDVLTLPENAPQQHLVAFNDGVPIDGSFAQFEGVSTFSTPTNSPSPIVFRLPAGGGIYNLDADFDSGDLVIVRDTEELYRTSFSSDDVIRVHGAPDADDLLIFNSLAALPRVIFDGGVGGNDALHLARSENSERLQYLSYEFENVLITNFYTSSDPSRPPQIKAIDLEPIEDELEVVDRWFEFTPAADQIAFGTGDDPSDLIWRIDSDNSEVVDFAIPEETLTIVSSMEDTLDVSGVWEYVGSTVLEGKFARLFSQGDVTLRLIGPNNWTNPLDRLDVDANGEPAPIDALIVINQLNRKYYIEDGELVDPLGLDVFPDIFLDVNGDGSATPLDALVIINSLNRSGSAEGEAEAPRWQNEPSPVSWDIAEAAQPVRRNTLLIQHDELIDRAFAEWIDNLKRLELPESETIARSIATSPFIDGCRPVESAEDESNSFTSLADDALASDWSDLAADEAVGV